MARERNLLNNVIIINMILMMSIQLVVITYVKEIVKKIKKMNKL